MKRMRITIIALALLLPLAGQAADREADGIGEEIRRDLAEAREEVRTDLARALLELEEENLRLDGSLRFGTSGHARDELPPAEITPAGDFLVEGRTLAIDARQRRDLLAYRGQVLDIARSGIAIGQRSAEAALDAVGTSWAGLLFGAMTGSLERRVERSVAQQIEPAVRGLCMQLPALMDSQQRLAASVPQFRPYATLETSDIDGCEKQIRDEFASR